MTDRISLATLFDGPFKHIKRTVKSFLKPLGIGSVMQTTTTDLHKQTSLFMEGRYTVLYRARTELEALLHQIYSDMGMLEWEEMLSPIDKSLVIPTIGHSSRTSSGFDEALQCDEKPEELAIIVSESRLKKFHPLFLKSVAFMHKGASVYNEIQSSIASFQDQNVHITYNNNTVQMNIGGFVWWSVFISSIQSCKELNITKKVTRVYSIVNEHKSYLLDDISLVTADKRYFVECEGEGKNMEEFFRDLKSADMDDKDIEAVKEIFVVQGIKFVHLNGLTERGLKEDGIIKRGVRNTILSVLGL